MKEAISLAYYDEPSFSQMQLDALARMRQMQQRSKSLVQESPTSETHDKKPIAAIHTDTRPHHKETPLHHAGKSQNGFNLLTNLFGSASGIDPEKLLIILMLYILYKNKADIKLLIALGYLLM